MPFSLEFTMHKLALSLALLGFAAAPAFASTMPHELKIELAAQNNSGETGYALIKPMGKGIEVTVHIKGGPKGVAQPDHIHPGTCANLNPVPKYPLENVVDGKSVTKLPSVSMDDLFKEPMAINVHESAQDMKKYVACGDIKK
ncbi:MAG: hypothetical protein B7Z79_09010 [Thiomonas sp. 20-64-9]|jgi:Cu/Zn superoxide dismutase|uniref:Uncharacterized protein n=2 Tax=Burkholderiales genera incertae sedis TaxID=224471 RepID=A0A8I1SWB4_THIA3|nr:hypothetical protein [Thiomonas arsenitoxydans]ODU96464.1 MAG: hypothetical protein ABT24_09025 [Thiomonas sp. SCN 64-16]OYV29887.1 MAG: hypothetical protein B7Z79_09010 [Thiomonas sp. 20-64-9]OZB70174.1 MAG: hypothetical protein B7X30_09855 [Thiomonas sp. 13-64-67]